MALPFPEIDPVALSLGPVQIRWYALAYLAGFLGGWKYAAWLAAHPAGGGRRPFPLDIENLLPWTVLGVILGGRLGYVLFYNPGYYVEHPGQVLHIWEGGMSFHGGLLGMVLVCLAFARWHRIAPLALGDIVAAVAPIGIFFGRIANFINGELFGRITTVPWAVYFPYGGDLPRHPSQLYEALLEGVVLFVVLHLCALRPAVRQAPGTLLGIFAVGYGLSRFVVEFVREPDPQIGLLFEYLTLGQLLCLPMLAAGFGLIAYARRKSLETS